MKHPEEKLIDYIDGTLGPQACAEIERHLASCPACCGELESQRALAARLRAAEPDVPSDRMWAAISARLDIAPLADDPWTARLARWFQAPLPRFGAAAAACLALALVFAMNRSPQQSMPVPAAQTVAVAAPAPAAAKTLHRAPVPAAPPAALAMAGAVEENRLAPAVPARRAGVMARDLSTPVYGARLASTGSAPAPAPVGAPMAEAAAAPARLPAAQGLRLPDGSFDWGPFEASMRGREHVQAAAELKCGLAAAGSPAERAFAASASLLLTQGGQPLSNMPLPAENEAWNEPATGLVVLQAADWNMDSTARQALYQGSVMTRLRGLRSEGQTFIIDWGRQQGVYAPGTRFVRLAGEDAIQVLDAAGQAVADNQVKAPHGAVYDFKASRLQLK